MRKKIVASTDLDGKYIKSLKKVKIKHTKTEKEVNRITEINPEIFYLKKIFDRLDNYLNEIVNIDY